jgi:hypothetical protein
MAALLTLFSDEFAVSLRSMTSVRRDGCRHSAHTITAIMSAERKAIAPQGRKKDDLLRSGTAAIALGGE